MFQGEAVCDDCPKQNWLYLQVAMFQNPKKPAHCRRVWKRDLRMLHTQSRPMFNKLLLSPDMSAISTRIYKTLQVWMSIQKSNRKKNNMILKKGNQHKSKKHKPLGSVHPVNAKTTYICQVNNYQSTQWSKIWKFLSKMEHTPGIRGKDVYFILFFNFFWNSKVHQSIHRHCI